MYEKLLQVKPQVESLKGIFTFDEIPGAANWKEVLDLGENDDNQQEVEDIAKTIQPDDLATLIYTSGTTGRPKKGVMLTHRNIVANVLASDHRIPRNWKLEYTDIKVLSFYLSVIFLRE